MGREKGKVLERDEAMLEQGEQVVEEGQGLLVLDLELEQGVDLEPGPELDQGADPQEGTLQVHSGSVSGEGPETRPGVQGQEGIPLGADPD